MKKFSFMCALAGAMLFSSFANAQDAKNPWLISVGAHAVDHTSVRGVFDGFVDTDDYAIVPPISKLSVARHLSGRFAVDLTASVGQIDNNRILSIQDELFINAGLGLRFNFRSGAEKLKWFDPYARIGASYHRLDYSDISIDNADPSTYVSVQPGTGNSEVPGENLLVLDFEGKQDYFMMQGGLGLNLWLSENFGINLASDYNMAPGEDTDYVNFFQHTAGVTFKFGNKDKDGDGIEDDEDKCPEVPGLPEFEGCPDTDGDGIVDDMDDCPEVAGPQENMGCPWEDMDGDGLTDNVDDCPQEAGPQENNGCPWGDQDGDGLTDNVDGCPTQAGPQENNGCPWGDADGDGFTDNLDKCPNEKGVAPDGCPSAQTVVEGISVGFDVEFDYNKASIRPSSNAKLDQKADQIKRAIQLYPDMTMYVDGHTDSKGSASYNQRLSAKRAASVVKALEARGIAEGKLTARGLGETVPKCTNDTEEGRQCNRRVEVTIKSTGDRAK